MQSDKCHSTDAEQSDVQHNTQESRFELEIDGELAVADYRKDGDTLNFNHTFVPDALRGKGIAAKVVRAGLEYAQSNNFDVVPQCSYVATYIKRHPEFSELVRSQ